MIAFHLVRYISLSFCTWLVLPYFYSLFYGVLTFWNPCFLSSIYADLTNFTNSLSSNLQLFCSVKLFLFPAIRNNLFLHRALSTLVLNQIPLQNIFIYYSLLYCIVVICVSVFLSIICM